MKYALLFWYGWWRGAIIGSAYTIVATAGGTIANACGLDRDWSICIGIIASQLALLVVAQLYAKSSRRHREIIHDQVESHVVSQITKMFTH